MTDPGIWGFGRRVQKAGFQLHGFSPEEPDSSGDSQLSFRLDAGKSRGNT